MTMSCKADSKARQCCSKPSSDDVRPEISDFAKEKSESS